MSKKDKKKTTDPLPPIQKFQNENLIEDLSNKIKKEKAEIERLQDKMSNIQNNIQKSNKDYIEFTSLNEKELQDKTKENAYLNEEIFRIRKGKEDFKIECKKNFDENFKKVEKEQKDAVAKVNSEMETISADLIKQSKKKNEYQAKCTKLEKEIERLTNVTKINIQNYEKKISDLTEESQIKLQLLTDIFENFLKNNQELLSTDLYTVYRKLKIKFDTKIKECLLYKEKNEELKDENKFFRISIDNNKGIIDECMKIQSGHHKKNKFLQEEIDKKDSLINEIHNEYQKQIDDVSKKCSVHIKNDDNEIENLKKQLAAKEKELSDLKGKSQLILKQRSEIEIFFMDALCEVRKEIYNQKKKEIEKRNNGLFPFLSNSYNYNPNNNSKQDDSIYVTSLKKVEIKDMDPESKEKILRTLLNKINEGKKNQSMIKLKALIS